MTADEIAKSPAYAEQRRALAATLLTSIKYILTEPSPECGVAELEDYARRKCRTALRVADLLIEESQK